MGCAPDLKNAILGTKMTPRMMQIPRFLIRGGAEVPPDRPKGELDRVYYSGLHPPPRALVYCLAGSAPGPPAPGNYFYY